MKGGGAGGGDERMRGMRECELSSVKPFTVSVLLQRLVWNSENPEASRQRSKEVEH